MFLDIENSSYEEKKLKDIFSEQDLTQIQKLIRSRGGEILQLQKHSASYSAAVSIMKHLDYIYHKKQENYSFGIYLESILDH